MCSNYRKLLKYRVKVLIKSICYYKLIIFKKAGSFNFIPWQ